MTDQPFLLVSLEEEKAKKLAQVLSNDTARKILDSLSKKEHATESEIASELSLALSTVHYNMQLLVKCDLVNDEKFTYSEKGKQVLHYSLSNKYVIIAPKAGAGLKEKLMKLLPVLFITTAASVFISYYSSLKSAFFVDPQALMQETAQAKMAFAQDTAIIIPEAASSQQFALYFLIGSLFALLIYFIWTEIILKRKK